MKRILSLTAGLLTAGFICQANATTATFVVSSDYSSFIDSPFADIASGNANFHLEDFEDGLLNTPGVSAASGIVLAPGPNTDSVDFDDGVLDGNGNGGRSFYANGKNRFTFTFSADALGRLPTHVGVVWTDVGTTPPSLLSFGVDNIALRAFTATESLGFGGIDNRGDGAVNGATAEDAFIGVVFEGGIFAIEVVSLTGSVDFEIDHLQYGFAPPTTVPVPGALMLFGSALAGLVSVRRRRGCFL